jgi:hypothetical protein
MTILICFAQKKTLSSFLWYFQVTKRMELVDLNLKTALLRKNFQFIFLSLCIAGVVALMNSIRKAIKRVGLYEMH